MRVKIGPYSGDLGKVVSVDYNADTAHVKVTPCALNSPWLLKSSWTVQ